MSEWEITKVADTPPEGALQVGQAAWDAAMRKGSDANQAYQAVITALRDVVPDPQPYALWIMNRYKGLMSDLTKHLYSDQAGVDPTIENTQQWEDVMYDSQHMPALPHGYQPRQGFYHEGRILTAADIASLAQKARERILAQNKKLLHEDIPTRPSSEYNTWEQEEIRKIQEKTGVWPYASESGRIDRYVIPQDILQQYETEIGWFNERKRKISTDRQYHRALIYALSVLPDHAFKLFDFVAREIKQGADFSNSENRQLIEAASLVLNELAKRNKPWPQINKKEFSLEHLREWLYQPEHLKILKAETASDFFPGPGYDPDSNHVVYEFPDGYTIRELDGNEEDLAAEGRTMSNCIRDYDEYSWNDKIRDGVCRIFSLRDPLNYPHVSMEFEGDGPPLHYTNNFEGKGRASRGNLGIYDKYIDEWFKHLKEQYGQEPEEDGNVPLYYRNGQGADDEDEFDEDREPEHLEHMDDWIGGEWITIYDLSDLEGYWDELNRDATQFSGSEGEIMYDEDDRDYWYIYTYGTTVDLYDPDAVVQELFVQLGEQDAVDPGMMGWAYDMVDAAIVAAAHTGVSDQGSTNSVLTGLYDAAHQHYQEIAASVRPDPYIDQMDFVDDPYSGNEQWAPVDDPALNPWGEDWASPEHEDITAEGMKMVEAAFKYLVAASGPEGRNATDYIYRWLPRYDLSGDTSDMRRVHQVLEENLSQFKTLPESAQKDDGHSPATNWADQPVRTMRDVELQRENRDWMDEMTTPIERSQNTYRDWRRERDQRQSEGPKLEDYGSDGTDGFPPLPALIPGQQLLIRGQNYWYLGGPVMGNQGDKFYELVNAYKQIIRAPGQHRAVIVNRDPNTEAIEDLAEPPFDANGQPNIVGQMPHPNAEDTHQIGWTAQGHMHMRRTDGGDGWGGDFSWQPLTSMPFQAELQAAGYPLSDYYLSRYGNGWQQRSWYRNARVKTASVDVRDMSDQMGAQFYLMVGGQPELYTVGQMQAMKMKLADGDDWREETPDMVHVFNAYDGESIIGSLVFEMYNGSSEDTGMNNYPGPFMREDDGGDHGYLLSVYVEPNYRGTGIFQQFMAICEQYDVPVYGAFTNAALQDHMYQNYDPYGTPRTANFVVFSADVRDMARDMMVRLQNRPELEKARLDYVDKIPSYKGIDSTEEKNHPYHLFGVVFTRLEQRYPESFKVWPWAFTRVMRGEVKRSEVDHFADIVGQAGSLLQDMRKHNRTPKGFDINQLSFSELETWLYENRPHEEEWKDENAVYTFKDGWTITKISSEEDCRREGELMGHCIGGYWPYVEEGHTELYSLRDPSGQPHASIEMSTPQESYDEKGSDNGPAQLVRQIQGKSNQRPIEKYENMIKEWFTSLNEGGRHVYWDSDYGYGYYDEDRNTITNLNDLYIWWDHVKVAPHKFSLKKAGIVASNEIGDYGLRKAYEVGAESLDIDWSTVLDEAAYVLTESYSSYRHDFHDPHWNMEWNPKPEQIGKAIYYAARADGESPEKIVGELDEKIMDHQMNYRDNNYSYLAPEVIDTLNAKYDEDEIDHKERTLNGDWDSYQEAYQEAEQPFLDTEFDQPNELSQYLYHLHELYPHQQQGEDGQMTPTEIPAQIPGIWAARTQYQARGRGAVNPHGPEGEIAMPGNEEHTSSWTLQTLQDGSYSLSHPVLGSHVLSARDLALQGVLVRDGELLALR